jgi:hypothetical protein
MASRAVRETVACLQRSWLPSRLPRNERLAMSLVQHAIYCCVLTKFILMNLDFRLLRMRWTDPSRTTDSLILETFLETFRQEMSNTDSKWSLALIGLALITWQLVFRRYYHQPNSQDFRLLRRYRMRGIISRLPCTHHELTNVHLHLILTILLLTSWRSV